MNLGNYTMTLNLFKQMINIESDDQEELLDLLEDALNDEVVNMLQYAQIKSDINIQYHQEVSNTNINKRARYTEDEILTVQKSHLDVYDGKKDLSAHLNLMKQMFSETSSQFRNGKQFSRIFCSMLDTSEPSIGMSIPANWADIILRLLKNRPVQFNNALDACQKIYDATDNGNMLDVVRKWKLEGNVK